MEELHFLRERRQELGLSQNDLELRLKSRGINLSRKVISAWERGMRKPHLDPGELEGLADALRWDVERLADEMASKR
jgi:transcriptional regulator with XRE-family HTH domain